MIKNAGISLVLVILNLVLFLGWWRFALKKLEMVSSAIDRIMDGEFPRESAVEEEGIFSRLESQFYQMARRLQVSMDMINREKEGLKSLVSDISHQIKTPLSSVKVFNSLLSEGGLSQEEEREFFNRSQGELDKLQWLAASLIKISRLETGLIEIRLEQLDIKPTILAAINEVYLRALEKNVEIGAPDLPNVVLAHDPQWTREALVNIVENAIKYSPEGGQVHVIMEKLETYVKIDIKDYGIGIPPHELNRIFERFYRGGAELVRTSPGSGIGLYLSQKILEEQGGGIFVNSAPGEGTCFSVLLPVLFSE